MKHYTSIEQSKRLIEFGLNPETADMCYHEHTAYIDGTPKVGYKAGVTDGIPCWSVGALLATMPTYEINNWGDSIQIDYKRYALETEGDETFIDLVVNMVALLLENGILKGD